jgi:diguanylate cyclase (GGDEF)-like protein
MEFITFKDLNKLRSIINAVSTSVEVKGIIDSAGATLPSLFDFSAFGVLWKEGPALYIFQEESCPPAFAQEVVKNMLKVFSILGNGPIEMERLTLQVEKGKWKSKQKPMDPEASLKSHLTLPLVIEGEVIGCISMNGDQANMYNIPRLQFFSVFGYQMAASLRHIQRFSTVKKEAIYDTLTNLFNRRHFEEELSAETQKAFENESNLSVIMVDIDHFKNVNDTFGHDGGDKVLRKVATLLKNSVRKYDTVARYGGEEFVLLLPGAPLDPTNMVAERIRRLIENTPFDVGQTQIRITISLGISNFPIHRMKSKEELMKMADLALYEAKRGGRNRVCVFKQE